MTRTTRFVLPGHTQHSPTAHPEIEKSCYPSLSLWHISRDFLKSEESKGLLDLMAWSTSVRKAIGNPAASPKAAMYADLDSLGTLDSTSSRSQSFKPARQRDFNGVHLLFAHRAATKKVLG